MSPKSEIQNSKIKVLLIEDDSECADALREMLSQEKNPSFDVECADKLNVGLERLAKAKFDVILLDLSLPDSHGLETLEKTHSQVPEMPIIVLTGQADESLALETLRKGAQEYLIRGEIHGKMLSRVVRYAIEREQAETAVHRAEQQNRFLLENSPTAFYRVKASGDFRLLFITENVRLITGYEPDAFLKDPAFFTGHIHPDDREKVVAILSNLKEGESKTCEFRWKAADGTYRWFRDFVKPVGGTDGVTKEIVGLCEDVTERHEIEERLKTGKAQADHLAQELERTVKELKETQAEMLRREKALATGELAGVVAHEIRNPLSIISMSVQYLQSKLDAKDPRREFAEAIIRKVQKLDSITKRLISYGRHRGLHLARRNLSRALNHAVSLIKPSCKTKGIAIAYRYSRKVPLVVIDEEMVDELFTNLLTNAVDAMPGGGRLTLETAFNQERHEAVIKISDTGCGIPPKHREHLFKPFFSSKKENGGAGLGLAISHRIVTDHGGTIAVESRHTGVHRGTAFTIRLPVQGPRVLPVPTPPRPGALAEDAGVGR